MRQTQKGAMMLGGGQEDAGCDTSTSTKVMRNIAARDIQVLPALVSAKIVRIWGALRVMSLTACPSTSSPNPTQVRSPPFAAAA
jgi:hypothetical protein